MGGVSGDIPVRRRARLVAVLRERGAASIPELAAEVGASESTVRRDIKDLSRGSEVRQTRGGAVIRGGTTFEPRFAERRRSNVEEKSLIGRYALRFVERGQSVFFDSSSTVAAAVSALGEAPVELTAVTNDVGLAAGLGGIPGVAVMVPGGELREGSFTLLGPATRDFLAGLHVDVALIGIHAVTGPRMSEAGLEVREVKRAIMACARRVVLLADHSKFGPPAFFDVAALDAVDDLVTDGGIPQPVAESLGEGMMTNIHIVKQ